MNNAATITMTMNKLPTISIWTVGRSDYFKACATIRQSAKDGYFNVKAEQQVFAKFPEAAEFEMDGFRTLEAAEVWCRETFARIWA